MNTATATGPQTQNGVEMETWENSTAGRVVIKKFNQQGALVDEMINGHRRFHVTPQERRINQEQAATEAQDVFQNGICQPIHLSEEEPDAQKLLSNPNVMNEAAMRALFKAKPEAFQSRLEQITHVAVLNRLLEVAVELDVSLTQYGAIQARLDAVAPLLSTEIATAAVDAAEGRPSRPVTPR
jgi:hypothetical protein